MKYCANKKAFTLPEVLVSMAVMVMVVFSATNLVVSVIRSNDQNVHTLIAYGLAQEGLEAVRNIRDSDWLLNGTFDGKVGNAKVAVWGATLPVYPDNADKPVDYTVDYNNTQLAAESNFGLAGSTFNPNAAQLNSYVPWILTQLKDEDYAASDDTLLYKQTDPNNKQVRYVHGSSAKSFGQSPGESTPFHRYIEITALPYTVKNSNGDREQKFLKYRVSSIVHWTDFTIPKEVRLDTELTNWKQGT